MSDDLDVKIPSGSYQGRTIGWVLNLLENESEGREWVLYALQRPWTHDTAFREALHRVFDGHPRLEAPTTGRALYEMLNWTPNGSQYRTVTTEYGSAEIRVMVCANCGTEVTETEAHGLWMRLAVPPSSRKELLFCGRECLVETLTKEEPSA